MILLLFCFSMAGISIGTVQAQTRPQEQDSQADAQVLPIPPELRKLDLLVGDWSGSIHSDEGESSQANSKLEASFRWILDGYCLEGVLRHNLSKRPYEARILWSYDSFAKQYRLYWINNFSSLPASYSAGPQPGNTLILSAKATPGVPTTETVRLTFSREHLELKISSRGPGGAVKSEAVLEAERKR